MLFCPATLALWNPGPGSSGDVYRWALMVARHVPSEDAGSSLNRPRPRATIKAHPTTPYRPRPYGILGWAQVDA
jgi:hypothetical protein